MPVGRRQSQSRSGARRSDPDDQRFGDGPLLRKGPTLRRGRRAGRRLERAPGEAQPFLERAPSHTLTPYAGALSAASWMALSSSSTGLTGSFSSQMRSSSLTNGSFSWLNFPGTRTIEGVTA